MHGYAHGFAHGYWDRPWYARPAVWGMSAWAIGSMAYGSGYSDYSNPYYGGDASAAGTYADYSAPIQVAGQNSSAAPADDAGQTVPPEVAAGMPFFDAARDDFKRGDYQSALKNVNQALAKMPTDAALHEFRALVQFAMADYSSAAATIYAVLAVGPGWDWTTLSSMYASTDVYAQQLRGLEQYQKDHPDAADAKFLLAYHYITTGHPDSAVKKLQEVVKLKPDDQLSAQLIKTLGGPDAGQTAAQLPGPGDGEAEPPEPPAVDAAKIVGVWKAKNTCGKSFTLTLTKDSKFTWGYEYSGKKQEFSGKYTVDGAMLVLERTDGEQMPGTVTLASNGFNFKLYGGPADDPGLDFRK